MKKYRVNRGYHSGQCPWIVEEASRKHNWKIIAEFWNRRDALLFRKAKNIGGTIFGG